MAGPPLLLLAPASPRTVKRFSNLRLSVRNENASQETLIKHHSYSIQIEWTGNDGSGTDSYISYRREYTIASAGKAVIQGSSDPAFRGSPIRYNPEELLVASLSSCHMLWYLHLCSINDVIVLEYRDEASGEMEERTDGSGAFSRVCLRPRVRVTASTDRQRALSIHQDAHRLCFIAKSVNFPINIEPTISVQS